MTIKYTDIDTVKKEQVADLLSKKEAIDISTEISDIYDIVKNTFVRRDKGEKHAELEVEIGDIHSDDFQPQFKIKRWDNECNFSIRLIDDVEDVHKPQTNKNKIEFVKEKTEAHFYDVPKTEGMPEGYEFEIVLKEKPSTNKVQMSIETKGLAFYYQPELTQEEKDEGAFRPKNVVGSYAVYHESKAGDYSKMGKKNYRAGKAFHIFRPRIIDNADKEVWGKLNIDVKKKLLTVEIPQEFLDNAVYPVIVDPTFGYETTPSSSYDHYSNESFHFVTPGYTGANGSGTSMSLYAAKKNNAKNIQMALYTESGGTYSLVSDGSTPSVLIDDVAQWWTVNFTTSPTLSEQTYYLLWQYDASDNDLTIYYDTVDGNDEKYKANTFGSWPSTFTSPSSYSDTCTFGIYCTYTAGGGLSMAVVMHHLRQQEIS